MIAYLSCVLTCDLVLFTGGRIVPRFQELTPEKLGKVCYNFVHLLGLQHEYVVC